MITFGQQVNGGDVIYLCAVHLIYGFSVRLLCALDGRRLLLFVVGCLSVFGESVECAPFMEHLHWIAERTTFVINLAPIHYNDKLFDTHSHNGRPNICAMRECVCKDSVTNETKGTPSNQNSIYQCANLYWNHNFTHSTDELVHFWIFIHFHTVQWTAPSHHSIQHTYTWKINFLPPRRCGRRRGSLLTCNCVSILLEPVICEFNLRKCAINRLISFRFIPSSNDDGTKRSNPNSRLRPNENRQKKMKIIRDES